MTRSDGRKAADLRPIRLVRRFTSCSPGSVLVEMGRTRLLCTAAIEPGVPTWLERTGRGWLTAEYGMLPASTGRRKQRDRGPKVDGRTIEIQRILGRSLRAMVDLSALGERTLWVDCDVLEADGGTRTAAITGGCVAIVDAIHAMRREGLIGRVDPLRDLVAATSVGLVDGELRVDLCYEEDSRAEVDLNVAMTSRGQFVEVQGTAEGAPLSRDNLNRLLDAASEATGRILEIQRSALQDVRLPG
jgi:ribonuclease PH